MTVQAEFINNWLDDYYKYFKVRREQKQPRKRRDAPRLSLDGRVRTEPVGSWRLHHSFIWYNQFPTLAHFLVGRNGNACVLWFFGCLTLPSDYVNLTTATP